MRLNFAQSFQGVAAFTGPLIAARWFFTGKNATTLDTVQWFICRFSDKNKSHPMFAGSILQLPAWGCSSTSRSSKLYLEPDARHA